MCIQSLRLAKEAFTRSVGMSFRYGYCASILMKKSLRDSAGEAGTSAAVPAGVVGVRALLLAGAGKLAATGPAGPACDAA